MGYDRRALNLRRAAQAIVADHAGRVPSSLEELERLPGIGPYTARAVAAIAFGARVSRATSLRTCCVIASRRTYWNMGRICE